jgi:mannose-6-phosphate isomerase-like protein (cupin superfamily)
VEVKKVADAVRFSPEKMVKSSVFGTSRLFVDVYGLEPGQAQKVHAHDGSDKVYVVREGRAIATVGGEERELGPDEAVLAPAGVAHGIRNASSARVVLLVVMAPPPLHA